MMILPPQCLGAEGADRGRNLWVKSQPLRKISCRNMRTTAIQCSTWNDSMVTPAWPSIGWTGFLMNIAIPPSVGNIHRKFMTVKKMAIMAFGSWRRPAFSPGSGASPSSGLCNHFLLESSIYNSGRAGSGQALMIIPGRVILGKDNIILPVWEYLRGGIMCVY